MTTPLNPDALEEASREVFREVLGFDKTQSARVARRAVSAYLDVAQPEVTTQEELDKLPHETVIRDSGDFVFERIVQHGNDPEWWGTTDFLNETKVTLPVRVLYLPEVKP